MAKNRKFSFTMPETFRGFTRKQIEKMAQDWVDSGEWELEAFSLLCCNGGRFEPTDAEILRNLLDRFPPKA